ncbi:MAG: tRNA (5-methylaminomethyl-2-thiouridylate)-methyltransferase [Proteobacteria bacterium]|nr:tRNA (5-methylaminomethyl-2-thiouridylate)-methyltransferase [Pseudomonadota bacterium]
MLAAKVILDQGVQVEGLNFYTGFCHSGHTSAIRSSQRNKEKRNDALWVAEQLGIKLHIIDSVEEYKDVLTNPQFGYGKNLNPCLDCKVFMVKKAKQWMDENGFDFIITGEVIGQRPKSQRKINMPLVSQRSGADDRLLRPLCAKNLPISLPEREGWVNREKLFDFKGRDRNPQFELAEQLGIESYAQPAGGCCVLTDENYSRKLADMWQNRGEKKYELDDIILLKVGRHLRPRPHFKMIIGRDEGENKFLEGYRKRFQHFRITSHTGPLILIEGKLLDDDLNFAARIAARFSAGRLADEVTVTLTSLQGETLQLQVNPLPVAEIQQGWYL